jgi:hypothetical protein
MTTNHRHHPHPSRYVARQPDAGSHHLAGRTAVGRQPGVGREPGVGGQPEVAREAGAVYEAGEVGPSLRDAVRAAGTWLQRVLDLAVDGTVEGGELGALLDLLPALDRGHAAAVALTDTTLQRSLAERNAGINYDTLLAMRTKATYTERGRLQRLAQLLRKTPNLRAAYHHGLLGTGQLLTIATEAKVLTGDALAAFDACFADTDRLARLEPDRLVDLARVEIDRHRPDLAQRRETRTVERSYLHLQPCLDGSGEGRFAYDADAFASIVTAIDTAAGPPSAAAGGDTTGTAPAGATHGGNTAGADGEAAGEGISIDGSDGEPDWFDPIPDRPRARQRADGLLALCEAFLNGNLTDPDTTTSASGGNGHHAADSSAAGNGAGPDGAAAGAAGAGGASLVEAVTSRQQATVDVDLPPRRVRRALRGRPRTRAVVVLDIAHLTDNDSEVGRVARLLWRLHGAPPALTPAGARRLASDADLQLLLTEGHTILGITAPTPTIPTRLREAVHARDQGCRFAGCRAPIAWCDLHHVTAREHGGHTILDNLVALCRRHHTAITTGKWTLTMTPDGVVTLRRGRIVHTTDPPLHTTLAPD